MTKTYAVIAGSVVALGLAVIAGFILFAPARQCGGSVVAGGNGAIGGPFTLVDHTGKTVTQTDVIDGPTLVYFGFTYCPDVCPLDTARNAEAVDILDGKGYGVKPVMISIDPARDTPAVMADYVEYIHPQMVGLTGSEEQVKGAIKAYKAYARKNGEGEDYLMDHSAFTYFMGPQGMIEFFRRDVPADVMADRVACYIDQSV